MNIFAQIFTAKFPKALKIFGERDDSTFEIRYDCSRWISNFVFFLGYTWRIIPGRTSVDNNHGDRKSPNCMGLWDPFQIAELHGL